MKVDGIEYKIVGRTKQVSPHNKKPLYGTIPLQWLIGLQGKSSKTKVIIMLWCLNGMARGGWFSFGNKLCKEYMVTARQKMKILVDLEKSGHIEIKTSTGKATSVKIIPPKGWRQNKQT
jgi:hypothetical protein